MPIINVAVFVHENDQKRSGYELSAYTRIFHPSWPGYNDIQIEAVNGTEAKRKAIKFVKQELKDAHNTVNIALKPEHML